jgi:hypothetical protein
MCCDHLVCARCAQPVSEAGCPVCRAARAELHRQAAFPLPALVALAALLMVLAAVLSSRLGG